jgi:hypothetical protein
VTAPSKAMFVTMGTSLFHSASWEVDEQLRIDLPLYEGWTRSPELTSPERRMNHPNAQAIRGKLKVRLKSDNADAWARRLPEDLRQGQPRPDTFLRYSAELATILKLSEKDRNPGESLGDFLRGYSQISLVCDSDTYGEAEQNLPRIAGAHLARYLNTTAGDGDRARVVSVPGLSSPNPEDLLGQEDTGGLGLLAKKILAALRQTDQLDLVISGGFKLYGIVLAPLLEAQGKIVRMLYLHEESPHLFKIQRQGEGRHDADAVWVELERQIGNFGAWG